ncbi:RNA polymerase sigma factor [Pseudoalteromonas pernae]|uniref:RNA polymerase sigma factor n=1 Tax=Pseudoalteromonas pernae TaxID=3118054 RepID=UPI003242E163
MDNELEFKRLVNELTPKLKNALGRYLHTSEVDDVIQDTFMEFYVAKQTQHIDNPRAFIFRISRNISIDRVRRKGHFDKIKQKAIEPDSTELDIVFQSERQHLADVINKLPPICRNVFVLRKVHDLSYKEIAQRLNISVKTVENHISNGIKLCQKYSQKVSSKKLFSDTG